MKNINYNKNFNQICLVGCNSEIGRDCGRLKYKFRLAGVPPNQALRLIKVNPNLSIAEIKKLVQREYKLNPILGIHFIFKGRILPDQLKFGKIGIHFRKDTITIMSRQGGGAKILSNWMKLREEIKNEK